MTRLLEYTVSRHSWCSL